MLCEKSVKDFDNTNEGKLSSENLEKAMEQMQRIIDNEIPLAKEGE